MVGLSHNGVIMVVLFHNGVIMVGLSHNGVIMVALSLWCSPTITPQTQQKAGSPWPQAQGPGLRAPPLGTQETGELRGCYTCTQSSERREGEMRSERVIG